MILAYFGNISAALDQYEDFIVNECGLLEMKTSLDVDIAVGDMVDGLCSSNLLVKVFGGKDVKDCLIKDE